MDSFREKVLSSGDFPVTKRENSKHWIEQAADMNSMYRQFESGDTITFFVMQNRKNQEKTSESESLQLLKTHLILLMVIMNSKSKKIALELADKHYEKYNDNQFRLWARMMVNKQHNNMDHPPNSPLITGGVKKHARKESLTDAISGAATAFVKPLASHRASPQKPPQPCAATNVINTGVSPSSKA